MGPVDLNDGLDDALLDLLHPVELLVENPSRLHRVDRLKIVVLPLDIHHDGERPLRMPPLLRRDLLGPRNSQISPCPEPDIVRQGPPRAHEEVRDALQAGEPHDIALLLGLLVRKLRRRSAACKEPPDHELKEPVLRGELALAAERELPDLVDRVAALRLGACEPHVDMVLPQPADEAHEPRVDP